MQIRINDTVIDYTLQGEKNLGDVLTSLDNLLAQEGYLITSVETDGLEVDVETREQWSGRELKSISELDISISHPKEIALRKLTIIDDFLTASEELLEGGAPLPESLIESAKKIEGIVRQVFGDEILKGSNTESTSLAATLTADIEKQSSGERIALIDNLRALVQERKREVEHPIRELQSVHGLIEDSISELSETPVLLQTGKDREAMSTVIRFTEHCGKLLRIYSRLSESALEKNEIMELSVGEGATVEDFFQELNGILKELADAMSAGDSVLTGDLLEYEVAPRARDLLEAIGSLESREDRV